MEGEAVEQDAATSVVHYTAYTYRSDSNFCLVIYNITFPADVVNDVVLRQSHLERTNRLIVRDFGAAAVVIFQVTGSYTLVHNSGATQLWRGSFYTHVDNNPSQIQSFRKFESGTFTQSCFELLGRAEEILRRNGEDSDWTFESLHSVIFNVQVKLRKNHAVIRERQMQFNSRFQKKFDLE